MEYCLLKDFRLDTYSELHPTYWQRVVRTERIIAEERGTKENWRTFLAAIKREWKDPTTPPQKYSLDWREFRMFGARRYSIAWWVVGLLGGLALLIVMFAISSVIAAHLGPAP